MLGAMIGLLEEYTCLIMERLGDHIFLPVEFLRILRFAASTHHHHHQDHHASAFFMYFQSIHYSFIYFVYSKFPPFSFFLLDCKIILPSNVKRYFLSFKIQECSFLIFLFWGQRDEFQETYHVEDCVWLLQWRPETEHISSHYGTVCSGPFLCTTREEKEPCAPSLLFFFFFSFPSNIYIY